ncbi:hypothetical protein Heshes_24300 [Alicyclobacillus hesperidum]|uniref:Uncharacterized protein n=1 Tax=Alicyclobacillus hesperidum TaxID=89784 RepID=A0A1H2X710_9BACL|nr:hypothetical protein [Alicyclobacillus hesperidum]GLV14746.1 hypothetical protein Heshes_24300 [Alicyclobacillus hesperidum]SDW88049.1 hypothetical protein SAMN04489725_11849 [Alicyclobacillus hesperidum]
MEMQNQTTIGTEELITCQRCRTDKPRSAYRQVANPTICLECYAAKRREARHAQVSEIIEETEGVAKQRVGAYLSPLAYATLRAMSLKYKSDSDVIEQLLLKAYGTMTPDEKAVVAYVRKPM